jgi:hypothetical protein
VKAFYWLFALVALSHVAAVAAIAGHGAAADAMLIACLGLTAAAVTLAFSIYAKGLVPSYNYPGAVAR